MMKLLYCILSLLSTHLFSNGFTTLKEFTDYAQNMPEYPENDTNDWKNPDYTSFHKQMLPSLKKRIINRLRMQPNTRFPVEELAPLLKDVSEYLQKTVPEGRIIKKILVDNGGTFFIWGELNGAFHSLVRSLNELERQGIINNDLKIIKPIVHFVFAGDLANKSPYLIETMFLILRLMQINPRCEGRNHEKVFYLKGKQEDRQEWLNTGLGRELRTRLPQDAAEKMPLKNEFSDFFNRLPLALYLMQEGQTGKKREAVRISYYGPDYAELEESAFLYFFEDYSKPVIATSQKGAQETEISVKVRAYIYAGSDLKKRIRQRGLSLISKKDTRTEWAVFSSPTASSRRLYQFFDDAFVELKVRDELSKWTLTLYRQDVRSLNGIAQETPVYLLSGEPLADESLEKVTELSKRLAEILGENQALKKSCTGVQAAEVTKEPGQEKKAEQAISALQSGNFVIGSTMDFSKQLKGYSESLKQGLNLVIDKANFDDGVAGGKKIQMIYLDDGYDPTLARANVEKLLNNNKTNVLLSTMGTPSASSYVDLVRDKKVLGIFPHTGAFHRPDLKNMVHLRTSYIETGHMIARYMAGRIKGKKVAFFYQNDIWGRDLLKGAKYEFEKAGITEFLDLPYVPNSLDLQRQAEELKNFDPDGIAFFGSPRINQEFIKEIGTDVLSKKILFGDTSLGLQEFSNFLVEKGLNMIRVQVVPNPQLSQLEIVKEFREDAKKVGVPINIISLEGYINASVFLDILQKIKDNISIENFIKAVEGIKDYNFKGLKLNFDPETRQLLHTVWFNTGEGDWPAQEVDLGKPVYETIDESATKGSSGESREAKEKEALAVQKKAQEQIKSEDDKLTSLQGKILKIGSTMDLSKGVKGLSDGYKNGMMLKLEELNAAGGVNGITFQLNVLDDLYEPVRARENVLNLIKNENIDLLLAPLGTPTTKAYLDLIREGKVLALFPIARSVQFRRPDLINIIQYQMSLKQEAETIFRYIYEKYKPRKIVIFYQNDDFGLEPKDEIERLVKTEFHGVELLPIPYERNNVNFKEQISKIKSFKPDALALQATTSAVEEFVRQIGADFLYGKILFGGSWLMVDQFLKSMHEKGLEVNLVSSVPDPDESGLELVQDFKKAARAKNAPLNVIYLEGYLYMALLAHAMKQIEAPYTKEKIINVFQGMKNYDFKGLKLNFNPETRVILQDAWIYSTKDNVWIKRSIAEIKDSTEEKMAAIPAPEKEFASPEPKKESEKEASTKVEEQQGKISASPTPVATVLEQEASVLAKKARETLKEMNEKPLSSVQADVLKIGSTMDLSKGTRTQSEGYKGGMILKLNEVNNAGGVNGLTLKLDILDDGYDPNRARINIMSLLNDSKIDLFMAPVGTPIFKSYVDLASEGKILVLFPIARAEDFRKSDLINVIQYQPSAAKESATIARYIMETYKIKRTAIFYQDDNFGHESAEAIKRVLKDEFKNEDILSVAYERNTTDFKVQADKIREYKPDAIAFATTPATNEEIIRALKSEFLFGKILYGGSWLMVEQFIKFIRDKGLNINLVSLSPNPLSTDIKIAQNFKDLAEKNNVPVNSIYFEGFIYMSLLTYVLKDLEKPITKQKIINAFEQMKNVGFEGLHFNFNPVTREITKDVWIYSTKDDSWTQRPIHGANKAV